MGNIVGVENGNVYMYIELTWKQWSNQCIYTGELIFFFCKKQNKTPWTLQNVCTFSQTHIHMDLFSNLEKYYTFIPHSC